MAAPRKG